jgi:hypothetical protein
MMMRTSGIEIFNDGSKYENVGSNYAERHTPIDNGHN